MSGRKVGPGSDGESARIVITRPDGTELVEVVPVQKLDELIAVLGGVRAALQTPVSPTPLPGAFEVIRDPSWTVSSDAMKEEPLLRLRDVRFGWLSYTF